VHFEPHLGAGRLSARCSSACLTYRQVSVSTVSTRSTLGGVLLVRVCCSLCWGSSSCGCLQARASYLRARVRCYILDYSRVGLQSLLSTWRLGRQVFEGLPALCLAAAAAGYFSAVVLLLAGIQAYIALDSSCTAAFANSNAVDPPKLPSSKLPRSWA
jgi:hypothetical protein